MQVLTYLKADRKRAGLIISLCLVIGGLIPLLVFTFAADATHAYTIAPATLTSDDGTQIEALVYTPVGISGNVPGVVVGHGFTGNKRYMQPLSIELVKRGWVVIAIDFRGHGSSGGYMPADVLSVGGQMEDLEAGVDYLVSLGFVNRIGLVGHSMGGWSSIGVAEKLYGRINATVSIGFIETNINFTRVQNLLMAVGQFDQLFGTEKELEFLRNYTGLSDVALNTQYGDFLTSNATKVTIAPLIEHLVEPINPVIIEETVGWLEKAFYGGSVRWEITITAGFNVASLLITMAGISCLAFMVVVYVSNAIWKRAQAKPERDVVQNTSGLKLVCFSLLALGMGGLLMFPLSELFHAVMPVSMGYQLFGVMVSNSIGVFAIYYLFIQRKETKPQIGEIFSNMRRMCGETPGKSAIFGVAAAFISTLLITAIMDWSATTTLLTTREVGTAYGLSFLFFPFLFVKEFYFRTVQGKLAPSNRVKEYFKMVGIGCFMDNIVVVPVMLLLWQNLDQDTAFLALSITAIIAISVIQQLHVTWMYMHSGRSILGSTVFLCIFYAWMIVNFFPYGL